MKHLLAALLAAAPQAAGPDPADDLSRGVFVVPNFHPASCGWLTDFSTERNYCAYSYLAHLDRVRDDPAYAFALSEVNNLMAILEFEPERFEELQRRVREGRVELVNAFFLEPTINLSGGEALVKMGVEGLRWQREVMGARPRVAWMIDVTGVHEQMGQIVAGLGLDGVVYTRDNPSGKTIHWLQSPDGTRTLAFSPGHYSEWGAVFSTKEALGEGALRKLINDARAKARRTPAGAPVLVLGGAGDYALPPARAEYPAEFLRQWKEAAGSAPLRFSTMGAYLDAVLPKVGSMDLPVSRGGARLSWTSFWIENLPVKTGYRRAEHALQSAEAAAAAASLSSGFDYPVSPLHRAWLLMLLNMDRNTLWGAAGGMVFEHPRSWDVKDRLASVEEVSARTAQAALRSALGRGEGLGLFNPLNWRRTDPVLLRLPPGRRPAGAACQADGEGLALCRVELPPCGTVGVELDHAPPEAPRPVALPEAIETAHYTAKVDPRTGSLSSLRLKPSGREVLSGPVLLVAESGKDFHDTPRRPQRKRLADSGQFEAQVTAAEGPLAVTVEARSAFHGGGPSRRSIRFHKDHPRIDFDVELSDIPDRTVVAVEFPLAEDVRETRRGIPYGFSHGAWSVPNPDLPGYADGIVAAVRWSHYQLAGGGAAILDRGCTGREITGRTPVLFLLNAHDLYMGYPCAWLSGKGTHRASFALLAHEGDFRDARIPQRAWEFNSPPVRVEGAAKSPARSFLETSDNVIVEALRREGGDIELRLAECLGRAGTARVAVHLPHRQAALTDLEGGRARPLPGGPAYEIPLRPQQIVTMRLRSEKPVEKVRPLLRWDELVPPEKLAALKLRLPGRKGHPPQGPGPSGAPGPSLPPDAARSLAAGKKASASNVYRGMDAHAAGMAVDGDGSTRWATDSGVTSAWLEVDLGREETIGRAWLGEAYDRVRRFELLRQVDGEWKPFARGTAIGAGREMTFEPVRARRVRLNVLEASDGPTIWEFLLFPPKP